MSQETISLDSIGLDFGTDKSSWHHNYLGFYDSHFKALRHRKIKLLEIGVAGGGSLKMWERYFPLGTIIGADINPNAMRFNQQRVLIEILDQSNVESLNALGAKHGPFDIIVEDGSHMWEHQITTLRNLFPFLTDDGLYVVEDLQTNYGAMRAGFRGASGISCVEYLKKLVDIRVGDEYVDLSKEEDNFLRQFGRTIKTITFHRHACLIQNGYKVPSDKPLLAVVIDRDAAPTNLSIRAHIGGYGDRYSETSVIRGRGDGQNIQGFAIHGRGPLAGDLSYRARYQNGEWTNWAKSGEFVGTRGKSEDLSGFSVRLAGQCQKDYRIGLVGAFRGLANNSCVGDGEDCISGVDADKLFGMQIILQTR